MGFATNLCPGFSLSPED
jgi:hypothetical protein